MKAYNQTDKAKAAKKRYYESARGKAKTLEGTKKYNNKIKGVYGIFDSETNDCLYVGGSKMLLARIITHKCSIKNLEGAAKHRKSQYHLYELLAEHKAVNFKILEECSVEKINETEEHYILTLKPKYNNYQS